MIANILSIAKQAIDNIIQYIADNPYIYYTLLIGVAICTAYWIYAVKQIFFTPCEGCMNGGHEIPISTKEGYQDLNLETVGDKLPAAAQGLAMEGTPELDSQVTGLPLANQQPLNTIPAEPVTTTTTPTTTTEPETTTTMSETTTTTEQATTTTMPETTTTTTEPETTTTTTTIPAVTIRYVNLADLENKKESQSAAMYLSA